MPCIIIIIIYSLRVFHWSLINSKSLQVLGTLLSILADLNHAVIWTVSTRPVFSKSSSPCTNPLVTVPRAPITIVTFMFQFFQFPSKVQVLIPFFAVFQFFSVFRRDSKVHNFASSLFFVDYHKVWSSGRDLVIRLYVKIAEEFVRVILQDRFSVVHIPLVRMIKFKFLAQFPVDHLAHSVVVSFIPFLFSFVAFACYEIDRFISITTLPTSAVLLCLIYSRFDMVSPFSVVLCCY